MAGAQVAPKLLNELSAGVYRTDLVIAGTITAIESLIPANAVVPVQPFLAGPEGRDLSKWRGGKFDFSDNAEKRKEIIELLEQAYWMEIESVMSYIANSVNPDGVRAQEIKEALEEDIQDELGHAQRFAQRIKELYGVVPGSLDFTAEQTYLQPPEHQTDVVHVIKGVIEAETGAIEHYNAVIEATEGVDPVTNDMVIAILRDEEGHRRLFEGYLREYEAEGLA